MKLTGAAMRYDDRTRLREQAKDCFVNAAAGLTQIPDEVTLRFVVLHAAAGLHLLAKSDPGGRVLESAIQWIEERKAALDG